MEVLRYIADQDHPVRLAELSALLGLEKSSVHRIARTLEDYGYVRQDSETSGYVLHDQVLTLARKLLSRRPVHELARKYLRRLVQETGETAHLAIWSPGGVFQMEHELGRHPVASTGQFGSEDSLHCTAVGKALLAGMSETELRDTLGQIGLRPFTHNTITSWSTLAEQCRMVAERGVAFDYEEYAVGVRCVASPVYDMRGRIIASLAVAGPAERLGDSLLQTAGETVKTCAAELSAELGFDRNQSAS